jgi:phage shock protein A
MKNGIETLLAPAEDPRESFADADAQRQQLLTRVRQARADHAAARARLETRLAQLRARLPQLETQARQAVAARRDDLARLALQQRQIAALEIRGLETQAQEIQRDEARLALTEQRLAAQLDAWRARQEMTAARYTAAEAQVRIQEALSQVSDDFADLGVSLEQAEQRAEQMQARALAIDDLLDLTVLELPGLPVNDAVAQQLTQTDLAHTVEAQLSALKHESQVE